MSKLKCMGSLQSQDNKMNLSAYLDSVCPGNIKNWRHPKKVSILINQIDYYLYVSMRRTMKSSYILRLQSTKQSNADTNVCHADSLHQEKRLRSKATKPSSFLACFHLLFLLYSLLQTSHTKNGTILIL